MVLVHLPTRPKSNPGVEETPQVNRTESASVSLHTVPSAVDANGIIAKIKPPKQPLSGSLARMPCDIVLVIDVSGSMGVNAPVPANPGEVQEDFGFSVLDLVKHAAHTICATLGPEDRLGIVTFSGNATVLLGLTNMTDDKKEQAKASIDSMHPLGATNLWHGIKEGIGLFDGQNHTGRVPAIMVLTDGQPNHLCPLRGYVPALKSLGTLPATIHTFGFGYSLRSGLLKSIAEISLGNYAFIPDAGMIGTVFVHAVANVQSTFAVQATLNLTYPRSVALKETLGESVVTQEPTYVVNDGATEFQELAISLGTLQYGQSRDIFLAYGDMKPLEDLLQSNDEQAPVITARLDYHCMTPPVHRSFASLNLLHPAESLSDAESAYHVSRSLFVSFLTSIVPLLSDGEHQCNIPNKPRDDRGVAEEWLQQRYNELFALAAKLPAAAYSDDAQNQSLLDDLVGKDGHGQVAIALSKLGYFTKWGIHYLPSLAGAHANQMCNSFKDQGPLQYGVDSPLFIACRNRLDSTFDNLPPPTPSNRTWAPGTTPGGGPAPALRMDLYNDAGNPCFAGNMRVELASGDRVRLEKLHAGMRVRTPVGSRKVVGVLETKVERERMVLVDGLMVTPWHPVSTDGGKHWDFPENMAEKETAYSGSIFSVLLQQDRRVDAHAVCVEGAWGVTLGHGLLSDPVGGDVRAHPFFGDWAAVERSLAGLSSDGKIDTKGRPAAVIGAGVRRDEETGLVCGFNPVI